MNLLPKTYKEFGERDYWNTFFKKRGKKAFEWYGEYLELCGHLHKYAKPKDTILITGCGNSSLSADLYDVGYTNITNIDISETAINQMNAVNSKREHMTFLCMDALNMTFEDEKFSVVIDKGTLDALMPDETKETMENIDKYFSEIKRVLKLGGRYICITLLQQHILKKLLSTFGDKSWILRVIRCHEAERKNQELGDGNSLPVFAVIATKFKQLPQLMLEVCLAGEKLQRVGDSEAVMMAVQAAQYAATVTSGLANNNLDRHTEVSLDMFRPGDSEPRYTVHVLDQPQAPSANRYAVFVVPQGRELDWMFCTKEGRRQLITSARYARLAVVTLHRAHQYASLDTVKEELGESAKSLAPKGFTGQIPILSLGVDVGKREVVSRGVSAVSGEYFVEDVESDGELFRRLIFMSNQFLVQSEAKLLTVRSKGKTRKVIDHGYLACNHHTYMSVGVEMARVCEAHGASDTTNGGSDTANGGSDTTNGGGDTANGGSDTTNGGGDTTNVAVIGLGGGGLCSFLHKCFDDIQITAVDIDEEIYNVAREHFGLTTDGRLTVRIEDGLTFIRNEADRGIHYAAVMLDVDSKDRSISLSCPPKQFLSDPVLQDVGALIGDTGVFLLNLVCRDQELQDDIMKGLRSHFSHIFSVGVDQEVNQVVFATNANKGYTLEDVDAAAKSVNGMARSKKLVKLKCLDVRTMLESLSIHS